MWIAPLAYPQPAWCAWPSWSRAHRWTASTTPRCSHTPLCTGPCTCAPVGPFQILLTYIFSSHLKTKTTKTDFRAFCPKWTENYQNCDKIIFNFYQEIIKEHFLPGHIVNVSEMPRKVSYAVVFAATQATLVYTTIQLWLKNTGILNVSRRGRLFSGGE